MITTVALASLASIVTVAFVFTLKQSFKATAKVVMIARAKVKQSFKAKAIEEVFSFALALKLCFKVQVKAKENKNLN